MTNIELEYAKRLAIRMWERDWKDDAPGWTPFDDIIGVLTQIANMVAGMERKKVYMVATKHCHGSNGINDSCKQCGRDLRDEVPLRMTCN